TNPVFLIGISEYKFTSISIPSHIDSADDGDEIWFSENTSKFLPEGSNLSSFSFSYEKIKEDENYRTYSLVVARKDYTDRILRLFNRFRVAGIFPFITSISSLKEVEESTLLIDFTSNKIQYAFYDSERNLFTSELYSNLYNERFESQGRKINIEELKNTINEVHNFLTTSFPAQLSKKIDAILCCNKNDLPATEKEIREVFNVNSINKSFPDTDPFLITSLLALNKFLDEYDSLLNFPEDEHIEVRDNVEKQAVVRAVLTSGIILMSLLSIFYLSNLLISSWK